MSKELENKIIAYFDGELSDADSAELLHLTSVSPEIRLLFREHEMLRDLAQDATRSVMVSPEVESSLFSRIESLASTQVKQKGILVFSKRTAVLAALALILSSGALGYFVPKFISAGSQEAAEVLPRRALPSSQLSDRASSEVPALALRNSTSSNTSHAVSISRRTMGIPVMQTSPAAEHNELNTDAFVDGSSSGQHSALIDIQPVDLQIEDVHSDIGAERHSPFDHHDGLPEQRSLFEGSLQTSSGFTYPADASPIKPFADQRISLAYHISENNLIGFRLGSGLYQQLGDVKRSNDNGTELISRSIETKRSFSEEIFVSHLEPLFFAGNLLLEFSLGGGLIPNGYTLDAEAGVRIPFSESLSFGAAFALSRVHSNALSASAVLAAENASSKPVMIDAADIRNTLNGRLHYGLIYRF
ncbi:MAG: hypothetical protein Q8916_07005 [Bacteroidota bacterium]|nr:hypothetical protein [Bacteroidota bacterium]MDP4230139.1 hypothetical protein [Bacteroidota bacterium]MDP4235492.1 hypothetical protein [Bacteroidota bacterium]